MDLKEIDWQIGTKTKIGDVVYIYVSAPIQAILYKTIVTKVNVPVTDTDINDDKYIIDPEYLKKTPDTTFTRLKLIEAYNDHKFPLKDLVKHGIKSPIRSSRTLQQECVDYLAENTDDYISDEECLITEGHKKQVLNNAYERSAINRQRCIQSKGYKCAVCDFDFAQVYGEIGIGFIHVHHLNPVSQSGETKVNPEVDLVPVCPNCHAMLHRRADKPYSVEELKEILHKAKLEPLLRQ